VQNTLQVPGTSWSAVSKWNAVLEGDTMSDDDYSVLHPMIVKDICTHFRYEEADGKRIAMRPQDMLDDTPSFDGMRDLFLAMKRKMGGADMQDKTQANRDKVEAEMLRGSWPKGKPPDIASW
jgi:hypothetical protein